MILHRLIIILTLLSVTYFFPGLSLSQEGSDAQEALLKRRVEQYWNAWVQGDWATAAELIRESDRSFFLGKNKTRVLSYKIESIALDKKDKTEATVNVLVRKSMPRLPESFEWRVENTWQLINGTWFINLEDATGASVWRVFGGDSPKGRIFRHGSAPSETAADKNLDALNITDSVDAPLEATYNFGEAYAGQSIEYKFKFQNISKNAVRIKSIESGCRCINSTLTTLSGERSDKKIFYPKELGVVTVKLNSKGLNGKIEESALVRLEDHRTPITLKITGFFLKNFNLTPEAADFGTIHRSGRVGNGEPTSMELTLVNNTTDWVKLKNVTKSSDIIDAQVSKYDLAPRDMTIVKVTLKPGSRSLPKNLNASVSISTNLEREPMITIPVKLSN